MKKLYFISPLFLQKLIWVPTRLVLKFFAHFEVAGLENLRPAGKNAIFALNHTSELDPILLPAALPFFSRFSPIFYTSREEKFYGHCGWRRHFYGGTFFKAWGAYPVFAGLRDYEKSLSQHVEIARDGGSVCVFPEGGITKDGNMGPAKGGISFLAQAAGAPVVPVRLSGAWRMTLGDFFSRRRKISVCFGTPVRVPSAGERALSVEELKAQANLIMEKVGELGR